VHRTIRVITDDESSNSSIIAATLGSGPIVMPPARPPAAAHVIVRRTTMTWANPGDRPSQPPLYPPLPPAYPASSGYPGQAGYARVEPAGRRTLRRRVNRTSSGRPPFPRHQKRPRHRPAPVARHGRVSTATVGYAPDLDSLQRLSHAKDQRSGRVLHARFIGAAVRSPEAPGRPRLSRRATRLGHQLRFGAGVAADLVGLAYIAAADGHD